MRQRVWFVVVFALVAAACGGETTVRTSPTIVAEGAGTTPSNGEGAAEVWEGSFTYDFIGSEGAPPCSSTYSVEFTVSEGRVSGEVVQEENSCPGASPRDRITGTRNGDTMVLAFFGGREQLDVVDDRVTATFSSTPIEVRELDVRCVTC